MGKPDPKTGQVSGGIGGAIRSFTESPFAQFWGPVVGSPLGQLATAPVRGATSSIMFGLTGVEKAESYGIARPFSTGIQALNIANPLYRNGVQIDDFVRMWNASEYISPGRAGITNIGTQIGIGQSALQLATQGGIDQDWNEFSFTGGYDPYSMSPEELEKKWDESPLGTVGSTFLDTAFVIIAGGKGVNAAASGVKRAAGLSTTIKSQRDLTKLRMEGEAGIAWKESGGLQGRETNLHRLIEDIAQTDDWVTIRSSPLLDNWTRSGSFNADELATQWAKVTDERLILDMALADRGDVAAIGRLFREAPDTAWSLMDMTEVMKRQFAAGGQFVPDSQTARIYNQTFESALERDEFWSSVKNTFMVTDPNAAKVTSSSTATLTLQRGDDAGGLISGVRIAGADTMPMGTTGLPVVRDTAAYAERWIKSTMANAKINRPNSWHEIPLGETAGRTPATRLLFWAGSRRPNNMIQFNSMRPNEIVDEMVAYSRSSRSLRQKEWTITRPDVDGIPQNVVMRDYEWRAQALARLGTAKATSDEALAQTTRELETELISVVANKYRVSATDADKISRGLRDKSDAYQAQVANDGFWIDHDGVRVVPDPVTRRQLPDSMVLMPLDDLDAAFRAGSKTSFGKRGRAASRGTQVGQAVLDAVYKVFRTNVLFRPGYIPKNSIGEPAVAALLADASLLPEGNILQVAGRLGENTAKRSLQFSYGITDRLPRSAARRDARQLDEIRDQYDFAVRQLEEIDLRIDDLTSAASPATRAKFLNAAEAERRAAYAQLKDVEARMGIDDPVWRSVDELPTYSQLRDRVQLIDDALNDPDFVVRTQARIDEIRGSAAGGAREASLVEEIASARLRLNELKSKRESLRVTGKKLGEEIKPRGTLRGGARSFREGESKFDQARVDKPRPDPVVTRRNESYARSVQYLEDRISEQELLVKNLEASRGSIRPLTELENAELTQLERLIALKAKSQADEIDPEELLANLRSQLEEIRAGSFAANPSAVTRKKELQQRIAELDGERRRVTDSIATRNLSRESARKRVLSGEDDITVRSRSGAEYTVPGAFSDDAGQFGAAFRADSSANMTASQTLSGGARTSSRWRQSSSGETINPFDPRYWDELAYVANRHVRGDDFANLFLQGKSQGEIIAWLKTPAGRDYRKQMGWTQDDIYGEASVVVRTQERMNQYFPNQAVKARLLAGDEVTPAELQKLMGDMPIEQLSPIYGTGLEFQGNVLAQANRILDRATNTIWSNLAAKPESRFGRWPFMQREYRRQIESQINLAEQQGLVLTGSTLRAMQRTSRARALKEMENTFYNIRRMAGPVYAMRYFMGFPAAAYNTAYRYGRLAYRAPGNAFVQANAWTSALEYFGVDEEGNRADNWQDIDSLVFYVPEEWGLPIDPKIRVKAESLYLGAQEGSFLPTATVPVSMLLMYKPELDTLMKKEFPDLYETMFGYGTGTGPTLSLGPVPLDPFMAAYQRKGIKVAQSFFTDIPDSDYLRVTVQDWQYSMYEWDKNGQEGPRPNWQDSAKRAREYYAIGTAVSFFGFGSYYIAPEGQFYRDEWFRIKDKHPGNFPEAQKEMLDMYGPSAFFLMRPTSKNRAGMPPTAEGLELYNEHEDLLAVSREINKSDPSMISQLMFLDVRQYGDEDFSRAIYDKQFNMSLPGETEPLASRLPAQEIEDEIKIQASWAYYNASKAKLEAQMLQYGYNEIRPDGESAWLYDSWKEWESSFSGDPDNRLWYEEFNSRDDNRALRVLNGIDEFLNNDKWMSGPGSSITWNTISSYRSELDVARAAYDTAEDSETRKAIAQEWDSYVRYWFLPQAGNFSDYYERFLAGRDLTGRQLLDREFDFPRYPIDVGGTE